MKRTHDFLYLKEIRKDNPKEYFKFLADNFKRDSKRKKHLDILDIGCATGEFIYFMRKEFPENNYIGMDILPELLDVAQQNNPEQEFIKYNINSSDSLLNSKFDFIFMSGVHSIFDETEVWIENLSTLLKNDGEIYLFGIFNPENLDVIIKSRTSNSDEEWETGWNLFSIETIRKQFDKKNFVCEVLPWNINIDIHKSSEDPLRSWTMLCKDNNRIIVNGLQLIHHFYLIKIKKGTE